MNYKTKDPSIKMFHVINNSLVTSDGFTYYSISFGIKHANKANKGVSTVSQTQSTYETSVAQTQQMRKR